jgi:hypothetical protein
LYLTTILLLWLWDKLQQMVSLWMFFLNTVIS